MPPMSQLPNRENFRGDIYYSAQEHKVSSETMPALFFLIVYFIAMLLIPWLITIDTETTVGVLFGIRPVGYVAVINAISNLLMNLTIFLILIISNRALLPLPILAALELTVVVCEHRIYRRKYPAVAGLGS